MSAVPAAVADAFGVPRDGEPLSGGQGGSFRHGDAVLKRSDDPAQAAWTAGVLSSLEPRGYRLPRPLRAPDGRWLVDGWTAAEFVIGVAGPDGRWDELLAAGHSFSAALAPIPKPGFLTARRHRWAHADRVAWGEADADARPEVANLLARLRSFLRPVRARLQLIHGDLAGNVLFADGLPPAIIDFSPYWRPVAYADAIVAVDGMLWYDGGPDLEPLSARIPDFAQLLMRALIFRLIALDVGGRDDTALHDELAQFAAVADQIERLSPARP